MFWMTCSNILQQRKIAFHAFWGRFKRLAFKSTSSNFIWLTLARLGKLKLNKKKMKRKSKEVQSNHMKSRFMWSSVLNEIRRRFEVDVFFTSMCFRVRLSTKWPDKKIENKSNYNVNILNRQDHASVRFGS